jgi:hypothetical protein
MNNRKRPASAGLRMCWLAIVVSFAALGACNKKAEDCRSLATTNREPLLQKAEMDVADDKLAEKKSVMLEDFLKAATPVQDVLAKLAPKDAAVGSAVSSYRETLSKTVAKASDLKGVFDEVGAATRALDRRLALRGASKEATSELLAYAPSPDERTRISRRLDSYASRPPEQRLSAVISFVESLKPTTQTDALAKALKNELADLKAGGDLEKKFAELETRSESGRRAFAAARSALRQSDSELTRVCKSGR